MSEGDVDTDSQPSQRSERSPWPLILCGALVALGCSRPEEVDEPEEGPPAHLTLYGVQLRHHRGAKTIAIGQAAKLTYQRENADFVAHEGTIRFPGRSVGFQSTGAPLSEVELRAPLIRGNLPSRQVTGQQGVTLKTASGLEAKTPTAHFDGEKDQVTGQETIQVTGTGYQLKAQRFLLEVEKERFQFEGAVWSRLGGGK